MSSACDGAAITNSSTKSAGCGTGPPACQSFPCSALNRVTQTIGLKTSPLTRNARSASLEGTVAAAREAKQRSPLAKAAKKAGSSASRGEDAPKPERLSRVLATRLHNFPDRELFL